MNNYHGLGLKITFKVFSDYFLFCRGLQKFQYVHVSMSRRYKTEIKKVIEVLSSGGRKISIFSQLAPSAGQVLLGGGFPGGGGVCSR